MTTPHETALEAAVDALQAMPGWHHAFRLRNEVTDVAREAVGVYLTALLDSSGAAYAVRKAISNATCVRDDSCCRNDQAQAALSTLKKLAGVV